MLASYSSQEASPIQIAKSQSVSQSGNGNNIVISTRHGFVIQLNKFFGEYIVTIVEERSVGQILM